MAFPKGNASTYSPVIQAILMVRFSLFRARQFVSEPIGYRVCYYAGYLIGVAGTELERATPELQFALVVRQRSFIRLEFVEHLQQLAN